MPWGVAWGCISTHEHEGPVETQWRAKQGEWRQTWKKFIHMAFRNGPWNDVCLHIGTHGQLGHRPKLSKDVPILQECGKLQGRAHANFLFYSQVEMEVLLVVRTATYWPSVDLCSTHCRETQRQKAPVCRFSGALFYTIISLGYKHIFFSPCLYGKYVREESRQTRLSLISYAL